MRRARQVFAGPFPTFAALLLAGVFCVPRVIETVAMAERDHYVFLALGCCALAPLAASVLAVRDARLGGGLAALGALLLLGGAALWVFLIAGVFRAFGGVGDHFADDLAIPEGLDVREPVRPSSVSFEDEAGHRVVAAAAAPHATAPSASVDVELPSLARIDASRLDALEHYLAVSPAWHVGEMRGRRIAYRRFEDDSYDGLHDTLWGYYGEGADRRSWRVALGFGERPFDVPDGAGLHVIDSAHGTVELTGRPSGDSFDDRVSDLIIDAPLVVSIYERGPDVDRPVTRAALVLLEATLASFLRGEPLVPLASGEPGMDLLEGMQPGMYSLVARVNPGEDGHAFVRAFEVTREVELSSSRLRDATTRVLPGTSDPRELSPYDAAFTIYEGNWGQQYAARFELWFAPDAGGPERMLMSDVFRIEGWMR